MSILTHLKEFEDYLRLERSLADNTISAYLRDVRNFHGYLKGASDGEPEAREVIADHVHQFMAHVGSMGMSPYSQARMLSGIKSFFRYLLFENLIESDPTELVDAPSVGRKLPDTLNFPEIEKILASFDLSTYSGARGRAMLEILYSSGLRVSELCGLKINDIHAEAGFLKVFGKGSKERLVPIGRDALRYLTIYLKDWRVHTKVRDGFANHVFLNQRGGGISRVSVFKVTKEAVKEAGLTKKVSPHTFRHSFATHLIEGGADLRAVQEMLGHESITTTEIYTHLDMDYLRQVITEFHPRS